MSQRLLALYEQQKELAILCAEMHTTGFPVHKQNREFMSWCLAEERKVLERQTLDLVGIAGFRCTPNDVRKLIFKRHETEKIKRFSLPDPIDPTLYTKTGQCSVNFDALLQILIDPYAPPELRDIVKVYWKAEEVEKWRSTFIASELIDHAIGRDGRCRPGWNSAGTDTGRFSCSQPNLMNLPQILRAMYCAANGYELVHGDYSQLELRVMAVVTGDPVLCLALASGDVYTEDAKAIYNLPVYLTKCDCEGKCFKPDKHVKGSARKAGKQVHLAFQYGAGPPKVFAQVLVENFEAKYSEVVKIHEGMKKRYSATVAYWFAEQERVLRDGYSASRLMDRRRAYPAEPPITEVANYPIQSTAADVMNLMVIRLKRRLRKEIPTARIICQLHDAVDIMAKHKDAGKAHRILKEEMETPVKINGEWHSFPTEIKHGETWDQV